MSDDFHEIGQMLDVFTERLPGFFGALRDTFFSAETGAGIGEAVGSFYSSLIHKGIPEEKAYELTIHFLSQFRHIAEAMKQESK